MVDIKIKKTECNSDAEQTILNNENKIDNVVDKPIDGILELTKENELHIPIRPDMWDVDIDLSAIMML